MNGLKDFDAAMFGLVNLINELEKGRALGDETIIRLSDQASAAMNALAQFNAGHSLSDSEISVLMKQSRAFIRDIIEADNPAITDEMKIPYIAFRNQVRLAVDAFNSQ